MKSKFIIYIPTDTREATANSFNKVAGIPLFLRSVLSLNQAGVGAFTVVAPLSHRRHLLKLWQKTVKNRNIHLNLVLVKDGHRLSADELAELKEKVEPSAFFINANYILPGIASTLKNFMSCRINAHEIYTLKPASKKSAIVGFAAQNLDELAVKTKSYPLTIEEFLNELAMGKNRHYIPLADEGLIVQKFSEIKMAEKILTEDIRKNTPMFVARELNKRISLPLSLILAKMRITPNTITVINIFIGLSAGIGAAGRTYQGVLLGAILFQLASIIDGCDGEVAKLTFRTSKFGQYIDSLSDNLSLAAFLTGMMIHEYRITGSYASFAWGGALILGALAIILIMSAYLGKYTDSASFVTYDREFLQKLSPERTPWIVRLLLKYFKMLFKKDLFSFMILIFAILGVLNWWFYIMTIGVVVGAGVLGYLGLDPERYRKV